MNPLLKGFKAACRPTDRRKVWEWCEDNVIVDNTSPMAGRWRSDNSPWVRELMECFSDNRVTDISVMCSAQSAKTQTMMCCMMWAIAEDPAPALWVLAAKDEAQQFLRDRLAPTVMNCKPVKEVLLAVPKMEMIFSTMPLYFVGAGSPSKLQSKPIRWLMLDEVRNYPDGALEMVLKRTRAFWNARRLIISTPAAKEDDVHRAFLNGDQRRFHFPCPKCGQLQPLKFEQVKWDKDNATKPEGKWNFDALAATLRYECVACGYAMRDTPTERKMIARSGKWVRENPNASRSRVSFTWNALLPPWVPWRSVVEEWLLAVSAAKGDPPDLEPLKTFITETLGEPWDDQLGAIEDWGFLDERKNDYAYGESWAEEKERFMAADKQAKGGEHYWWVVRAFGPFGKSRLIAYGRCNTKEELEETRKLHNVPNGNAIIDSGYKAPEVYRFCLAAGWKPFKGDDAEFFLTTDKASGKSYRRIWRRGFVDALMGQRNGGPGVPHPRGKLPMRLPVGNSRLIPLYQWSNPSVKDLLAEFMRGLVGEWTLPKEIGKDYMKQVTADRRVERQDPRGRIYYQWQQMRPDNHLKDCEEMLIVAAVVKKLVSAKGSAIDVEPEENADAKAPDAA